MRAWMGWTATLSSAGMTAPTWEAWRARQQGALRDQRRRRQDVPFSERELTCLLFVRWLYQTGRLDPREHDNL
jgi:hypothetical protein